MTDSDSTPPQPPKDGDLLATPGTGHTTGGTGGLRPQPPSHSPWLPSSERTTGKTGEGDLDDVHDASETTRRIRLLGMGGQGSVMLVEHLGQLEAHKSMTVEKGSKSRLFREALHTRRVDHPNIVKVFGAETIGGAQVLRMEYIEGRDLGRIVDEDGTFTVEELLPLALQVSDALQATHERETVHLDLKPSNLILRKDGRTVVVTDFGISAALREVDGERRGGRGGTPFFMAPELHGDGGKGTVRSDIWSLGVTLYWLATSTYPFDFKAKPPAEAVEDAPRDPTPTHRHVSPRFWHLVRRMLRADPEGRTYESMAEVHKDLEELATSIQCPACQGIFRLESVSGMCPEPSCQKPDVAQVKEQELARRSAEVALADCAFEQAAERFGAAAAAAQGELADELRRLAEVCPALSKEHEALVAEVRELLERDRLVECTRKIYEARVRFSRSPSLRTLRQDVRGVLVTRYRELEGEVTAAIRRQDFASPRERLTTMDLILGEPFTSFELRAGLDTEPGDFQWLYNLVEEKELLFNRQREKARSRVMAFEFGAALKEYARLEAEFPSEENLRMLNALRDAARLHAQATAVPLDLLRRIVEDPDALDDAGQEVALGEGARASKALVQAFPVEDFAAFQEIAEREVLFTQASETVRAAAQERLEAVAAAREDRDLDAERRHLEAAKRLVLRCDLFERAEREELARRDRELSTTMGHLDELKRDVHDATGARDWARASAAVMAIEQVQFEEDAEFVQLKEEIAARRKEVDDLREMQAKAFAEIERGHFDLDSATAALREAEVLWELLDDRSRGKQDVAMARVVSRLLASQVATLRSDGGMASDRVLPFLVDAFLPVVRSLSPGRWASLLEASAELSRGVCALLDDVIDRLEFEEGPLADVVAVEERMVGVLESAAPMLADLNAPSGVEHPGSRLVSILVAAFLRAPSRERKRLHPDVVEMLRRLAGAVSGQVGPEVEEALETLRRAKDKAVVAGWLSRAGRVLLYGLPAIAATAAAGWLGYGLGQNSQASSTAEAYEELVAQDLGLAGSDEALESVLAWLGKGGPADVAVVQRWAEARAGLGAQGPGLRRELLPGLARDLGVLEEGVDDPAVAAAFRTDLEASIRSATRRLFDEAVEVLAEGPRVGSGAAFEVARGLDELSGHAASCPGGSALPGQLVSLQDSLRDLVDGQFRNLVVPGRSATERRQRLTEAAAARDEVLEADVLSGLEEGTAEAFRQYVWSEWRRVLVARLEVALRWEASRDPAALVDLTGDVLAALASVGQDLPELRLVTSDDPVIRRIAETLERLRQP